MKTSIVLLSLLFPALGHAYCRPYGALSCDDDRIITACSEVQRVAVAMLAASAAEAAVSTSPPSISELVPMNAQDFFKIRFTHFFALINETPVFA